MAATLSDWFRRTLDLTRGSVVRVSLARFVLLSALALLVLGVGIRAAGRHIAEEQAMEEATDRATGVGRGFVSTLVDSGLRAGEPGSIKRVKQALSYRLNDGTFSHIVIFDAHGRVLWSDVDKMMVGDRVRVDHELAEALRTGKVVPRPPEDDDRHPVAIGGERTLLDVNVPLPAAQGGPVMFRRTSTRTGSPPNGTRSQRRPSRSPSVVCCSSSWRSFLSPGRLRVASTEHGETRRTS